MLWGLAGERRRAPADPKRRVLAMHTIELNDDELRLLQNALHAYLDDFGHEEADVLRLVKALIAKLQSSQ
jgi:hypothetical protein